MMDMRFAQCGWWLGILLGLVLSTSAAEPVPERLFGLTNLWEFHISVPAAEWDAMTPAEPAGRGFPGGPGEPGGGPGMADREYPWGLGSFRGAGCEFTNVAVRFKGNSSFNMSRQGLKRPFKLNFNRGAKGRALLGHKEVVLNNNLNDGAQFREALAYDVFRRAGLPAPRTAFARVQLTIPGRMTNVCLGLYTVVEVVENDFLEDHWGTRKGLLVKPERLPGLRYLGEQWAAYTNRYQPKTQPGPKAEQRFIEFVRRVDQADDAEFRAAVTSYLEVTNLLRFVAVNAVLANYDSLIGTGHNYYLFQPSKGASAALIPWDLNEAFGGHPPGGSRTTQAGFSVLKPLGTPIRLVERVLANPDWAALYRLELASLIQGAAEPGRLVADARRICEVTGETVRRESPAAWAAFQKSALGITPEAGSRPVGPQPADGQPREPRSFRGGPPGGPFGRMDEISFADWVKLRHGNIEAELDGRRNAPAPQLMRGPGGPGGPGGPRPPRPEGPPRR